MTAARRPVTTVLRMASTATGMRPIAISKELVAMREETFSEGDLSTPRGIGEAFHKVQRHIAEATQAARSLPCLGGAYLPSVVMAANTATPITHGIAGGLAVAWMALSVRPTSANAAAVTQGRVIEVSQDAARGRITLASSEAATVDLWIFPRPSASAS